jgi:hypothetical protein
MATVPNGPSCLSSGRSTYWLTGIGASRVSRRVGHHVATWRVGSFGREDWWLAGRGHTRATYAIVDAGEQCGSEGVVSWIGFEFLNPSILQGGSLAYAHA